MSVLTKQVKNIINSIKKASVVYIIGHSDLDLDAFGAELAVSVLCDFYDKKNYILIGDRKLEKGVIRAIDYINVSNIITPSNIGSVDAEKSLLIIVDTNSSVLVNKKVLDLFTNKIVIDHHELVQSSIIGANNLVDGNYSSCCEILYEMLSMNKIKISDKLATIMLSGIVMDTCNYVIRTRANTFYVSYELVKNGASVNDAQYLLKSDLDAYIKRQKVITDVRVMKTVALSKGLQTEVYRKEELAKIADTLLLFDNISTSIVIGKISKKEVGISARSNGEVSVGKLMQLFGGGGDMFSAAAKITDTTVNKVSKEVEKMVRKINKEGGLK